MDLNKTKLTRFAYWVLEQVREDEEWEINKNAFPELVCRQLLKLGILRLNGDKYEIVEEE